MTQPESTPTPEAYEGVTESDRAVTAHTESEAALEALRREAEAERAEREIMEEYTRRQEAARQPQTLPTHHKSWAFGDD